MMRYSLTALDSNKPISLRIAHFAQFRAGRLTNFRVLVDTFDLVEQTVGSTPRIICHLICRGWRFEARRAAMSHPAIISQQSERILGATWNAGGQ